MPGRRHASSAIACVLAWGLALHATPASAQSLISADVDPAAGTLPVKTIDARVRLGAERVHLPGGERMGLLGLTELLSVGGEWWAGPGVYGAATGRRGGLFVPGFEGAWSHPFNDWLAVDAGLFVGGGGGGAAPVGGGLMLRPHADFVFRFPGFYTGPTWSKVRFTTGQINSNQFGWMINFASSFRYRTADHVHDGAATDGTATGLGFDRIDAVVTEEKPKHSKLVGGAAMTQTIGLVGVRAERNVDGPLWAGIETAGAATGGVAGYAEALGTLGVRFPVVGDRFSVDLRGAAGVGGGGGIDTGGGFLVKGATGLTLRLSPALAIGAEAGVVDAPRGHFKAATGSVLLNWTLDAPLQGSLSGWDTHVASNATRMEFSSGVERYRAARKSGPARPLDAVELQVNRFVTSNLYLAAHTHSAYAGGAGAYTSGMFGVGVQVPVVSRLRLGVEALGGAAGGGGVATGGGKVVQARGYVDLAITDSLSLRVGGGKIKAGSGGVDATTVDAALVFRFGVDRKR